LSTRVKLIKPKLKVLSEIHEIVSATKVAEVKIQESFMKTILVEMMSIFSILVNLWI